MNSFLELLNIRLSYEAGKRTGLPGIIGILVFIGIVYYWHHIEPGLAKVGIISAAKKADLIVPSTPYLTWYRLFGALIAISIILMIIGLVLIALVLFLSAICSAFTSIQVLSRIRDFIGKILCLTIFHTIFLPFYIVLSPYFIYKAIDYLINFKKYREERKARAIAKMMNELEGKWSYIKSFGKELSLEEAIKRLNRLPILGDTHFLVGVKNVEKDDNGNLKQNYYMLLPKPIHMDSKYSDFTYKDTFTVIELDVKYTPLKFEDKFNILFLKELQVKCDPYPLWGLEKIYYNDFEHFLDIYEKEEFKWAFESYSNNEIWSSYVNHVQMGYFLKKNELINDLKDNSKQLNSELKQQELDNMMVSNDDIVSLLRYGY